MKDPGYTLLHDPNGRRFVVQVGQVDAARTYFGSIDGLRASLEGGKAQLKVVDVPEIPPGVYHLGHYDRLVFSAPWGWERQSAGTAGCPPFTVVQGDARDARELASDIQRHIEQYLAAPHMDAHSVVLEIRRMCSDD